MMHRVNGSSNGDVMLRNSTFFVATRAALLAWIGSDDPVSCERGVAVKKGVGHGVTPRRGKEIGSR